ncbi:DNA-directed RNA polymerase III subunit RPC9 [Entamoeba marina]
MNDMILTNAELMSLLNSKVKRRIDLTPFEYFVYRHHETQTAAPLFRKRRLLKYKELLDHYDFSKEERVLLVNYPPTSLVEFYVLINDPEDRFSEEEMIDFMNSCKEVLELELSEDEPRDHRKREEAQE